MRFSEADVAFLRDVSAAVFHNPFSPDRHEVDLRLADADGTEDRATLLAKLVTRVQSKLETWIGASLDVRGIPHAHRRLAEHAALFVLFHRYSDPFDDHIERQQAAGAEPIELPCGKDLLRDLSAIGLTEIPVERAVAVLFQMRRAFYFIDRGITGVAPSVRALRQQLWNNVFTADIGRYARTLWNKMEDFSTIVLGPTGSGKGNAAAAIGRSGYIPFRKRARRFEESFAAAFVPLNLSAYAESLIESELFGHVAGAFTGAVADHEGVFDRCSAHGAVFLDEIGELAAPVQIKLLRVLQERTFFPVGSHAARPFRGRVIAATHRDLQALRREGRFREDFYYRLCSDIIEVPSLRQRLAEAPEELELLLRTLVVRIASEDALSWVPVLAATIERSLGADYPWPGNVRELEQCVRRSMLGQPLVPSTVTSAHSLLDLRAVAEGRLSAQELLEDYCDLVYAREGTYEGVARRLGLDRRTAKKHIVLARRRRNDRDSAILLSNKVAPARRG